MVVLIFVQIWETSLSCKLKCDTFVKSETAVHHYIKCTKLFKNRQVVTINSYIIYDIMTSYSFKN